VASALAGDGRTTVAGTPAEVPGQLAAETRVVFLPSEKPMAKKKAQTSTKAKKITNMRPVPSVISVSCCAVDMEIKLTL
jgi:hypothetical protein